MASDAFIKFDDGKLMEEALPRFEEVFRRSTNKDLHPGDSANHQAFVTGKLFGGGRNAVEVVNQHIRIDAGGHYRLLPLLPKPPHEFNGIFLSKALAASEGGMAAKVKPRPWLRWEEGGHGSTHRLGPGNALFFPIAVEGLDLLLRKIDDGPHDDIIG
ncbi:MAG TPA: hypothetical protein VIS96_17315 [Terrimicrobiaceae bacterium]